MKRILAKWGKPVLFLLGLLLLTLALQPLFKIRDPRPKEYMSGFYLEKQGALDGVFIGGSSVYTFWQAPLAFRQSGITVYPVSVPNMPQRATLDLIKECRRTQPDALYILCINQFGRTDVQPAYIHNTLDFMPITGRKPSMIPKLSALAGLEGLDMLEFFLPILRFHSTWSTVNKEDVFPKRRGYKGGYDGYTFRNYEKDVSDKYWTSDDIADLAGSYQEETLTELCDYLEEEQIRTLFVCFPQAIGDQVTVLNGVREYVRNRGFEVLDLYNHSDTLNLDCANDYSDRRHVNIHGAAKTTKGLLQYLLAHYSFADKRTDPSYRDWNEAADKYLHFISRYALDYELDFRNRTLELAPVAFSKAERKGDEVLLEWERCEGAAGYVLFRKLARKGEWTRIAELSAEELSYREEVPEHTYRSTYLIVPVAEKQGTKLYGRLHMENKVLLKGDLSTEK